MYILHLALIDYTRAESFRSDQITRRNAYELTCELTHVALRCCFFLFAARPRDAMISVVPVGDVHYFV